ncbi:MAG: hypothetical protein WBB01_18085 [Phormidesmis sp.]
MPTKEYKEFLFEQLTDSGIAAEYLTAAVEDSSSENRNPTLASLLSVLQAISITIKFASDDKKAV